MAIRTLKRTVLIREYDFNRVRDRAFEPLGLLTSLYDRAEWEPLTKSQIERETILKGLKGITMPKGGSWLIPEDYLLYNSDSLYNKRYPQWNPNYDSDGYIWIQARKNTPRSRLGWAVFEKDLESRL